MRGLLVQEADGSRDGFARQLLEGAAGETGITLEFVQLAKGDIGIPRLLAGEIDAICPLSISPERMESVEFTSPLLIANGAVFFRAGERGPSSVQDLAGLRVAVALNGKAHQFCIEKGIPCRPYSMLKTALESVLSGESDCVVTPQAAGRVELQRVALSGLEDRVLDEDGLRFAYAIAVPSGRSDLVARLNTGLELLRQDGRWDELYDRWVAAYQPRPRAFTIPTACLIAALALAAISTVGFLVLRARLKRRTGDLRESEQRFRAVAESLPALVYSHLVYPDGRCERRFATPNLNDWLREFPLLDLGSDDRRMLHSMHPEDRAAYESAREASRSHGARFDVEFRLRDEKDRYRWLHSISSPIVKREGVLWQSLLLDVTPVHEAREERHRLQLELLRSQRLEGLGLLAGGIAGDFDNLLAGVQGQLERSTDRNGEHDSWSARLQAVQDPLRRATELTRQLLDYAGDGHLAEEVLDLSQLVRESVAQQRSDPELAAVGIVLDLADPPPFVKADGVLLRQVVGNLLAQVRGSQPEGSTRIVVRTGRRERDPGIEHDALGKATELGLRNHAFLEIEVAGRLLDETSLHLFDPFFAARASGRGMALAIVQRVVERQNGAIYAHSAPGRGTTIVVLLPEVSPPIREAVLVPRARSGGRVLVIDDDPGVREVVCAMLAGRGWSVQRAVGVRDALTALRGGMPDVVLLDLTLPSADALGEHGMPVYLRNEFPALPIVLMSGLSDARSDEELGCANGFVQKPFSGAELHGALERALGPRTARQPLPAN